MDVKALKHKASDTPQELAEKLNYNLAQIHGPDVLDAPGADLQPHQVFEMLAQAAPAPSAPSTQPTSSRK